MPKLATADFYRNHKLTADEIVIRRARRPQRLGPRSGHSFRAGPRYGGSGAGRRCREFGTKSFAETVEPAIDLADGFPIDEIRASYRFSSRRNISSWPTSKKVFCPGGDTPQAGDIFRQPDLARTLRAMAAAEKKRSPPAPTRAKAIDAVRDYFYRGEIAHKIDEFMKPTAACCATKIWRRSTSSRKKPSPPLSRLHSLQAWFLEPGAGHDRDAEYS